MMTMAQHFLLSAAARTLSLKEIFKAGEDKAYETFKTIRWASTEGNPVCPKCGCLDHYAITSRRKFKCAACGSQYSVTSGTIFASRKLPFTDLLGAISIFVNAVKGMSALQLSRDLDVQYKTAWVLAHKLREALSLEIQDNAAMSGDVEVDGAYFGGHIRPHNIASKRVDRRRAKHQTGLRRVVVAFRERLGRTRPFIAMAEAEGVELAKQHVDRMAIMHADEATHWDALHTGWNVERVNHSQAYSDHGKHTNWVESYFSRLRCMVTGQHHFVSPQYLYQYANHAAWLEDNRRNSNGANAVEIIGLVMAHPVSRVWKGYWQRKTA
jgi:transposase-like protein